MSNSDERPVVVYLLWTEEPPQGDPSGGFYSKAMTYEEAHLLMSAKTIALVNGSQTARESRVVFAVTASHILMESGCIDVKISVTVMPGECKQDHWHSCLSHNGFLPGGSSERYRNPARSSVKTEAA